MSNSEYGKKEDSDKIIDLPSVKVVDVNATDSIAMDRNNVDVTFVFATPDFTGSDV